MIKPEFWSSQTLHTVSLQARLLFVGIWNFSDDFGVCLDSDRKILGEIFPLDDNITEKKLNQWKKELIDSLLLIPVQYNDAKYLVVRSWDEHQKVDHPSGRKWLDGDIRENLVSEYLKTREPLASDSRSKEERGKKKEKEERERPQCVEDVFTYMIQINIPSPEIEAATYWDHFNGNGWKVGRGGLPMKDWKATVRTWKRNGEKYANNRNGNGSNRPGNARSGGSTTDEDARRTFANTPIRRGK
jgi:hypothetical protein